MALVKNTRTLKGLLLIMFGAGIAMMIVLWNIDTGPSENHTQPKTTDIDQGPVRAVGTTTNNQSSQPSDQQKQPVIPPSDSTNLPRLDEVPSTVETNLTEGGEFTPDGGKIYTMDTIPMDKSGIYWVRDSEGNLEQIAVDVPGPDSAAGLYE